MLVLPIPVTREAICKRNSEVLNSSFLNHYFQNMIQQSNTQANYQISEEKNDKRTTVGISQ